MKMAGVDSVRTIYPRLPDILDGESLDAVATLEGRELEFARSSGRAKRWLQRALCLKAMAHFGHSRSKLQRLPVQMRAVACTRLPVLVQPRLVLELLIMSNTLSPNRDHHSVCHPRSLQLGKACCFLRL